MTHPLSRRGFESGQCHVFSSIVELSRRSDWLVCPLPFNRAANGFFTRYHFTIAKLFADSIRRRHNMLRGVSRPEQMFRRAVMWQDDKFALPVDGCGNFARPI